MQDAVVPSGELVEAVDAGVDVEHVVGQCVEGLCEVECLLRPELFVGILVEDFHGLFERNPFAGIDLGVDIVNLLIMKRGDVWALVEKRRHVLEECSRTDEDDEGVTRNDDIAPVLIDAIEFAVFAARAFEEIAQGFVELHFSGRRFDDATARLFVQLDRRLPTLGSFAWRRVW